MTESQEQLKPQTESIFFDWSPYQGKEVEQALKEYKDKDEDEDEDKDKVVIKNYTAPTIKQDLRDKIESYLNTRVLSDNKMAALTTCLSFLERGIIVDKYGNNEEKRHKFLFGNKIKIGDEEITLYEFSKRVNKLSGNQIALVIFAGQIIDNKDIEKRAKKLMEEINKKKGDPGYFIPEDLDEINTLATDIINSILES